jgi:N-acetylneuraminic acid mutarotase
MPERLQELYAALGNDPFLIKECLVRPALVDRLTRNFYAFDSVLHAKERAQADALHARLVSGQLTSSADEPHRAVIELSVGVENVGTSQPKSPAQARFTSDEFRKLRLDYPEHVGDVSIVKEARETFTISVVLSETKEGLRVANYVFPKTNWDAWWVGARLKVQGVAVAAVATGALPSVGVPALHPRLQKNRTSGTCADDYWDNGSLDDVVPGPRVSHVSVWTGTQMIVWGGGLNISGFSVYQTGGCYDPATDTWTPTSVTGAPSPRIDATAVWTGHEMVVWGGQPGDSETQLNSGGRYDPVSDTWTPTTGRGAPGPRYTHSAVWTGSRMVIWGGYIHYVRGRAPYVWATGGQYDPATDSWTPTSLVGVPYARAGHSAVWTGQYMVVWGGNFNRDGGRYDPVNDRWLPMSYGPQGRTGHSAVWTGTEMIVWGGSSYFVDPGCGGGICYREIDTGGRYDPVSDTWIATSTSNAPTPRQGHRAVWTGSSMLVWGGSRSQGTLYTGGRYDPATDSWLPTAIDGAPQSREFFTAVWTGNFMVVWGGVSSDYPYSPFPLNTGGRYDPLTDSWTEPRVDRQSGTELAGVGSRKSIRSCHGHVELRLERRRRGWDGGQFRGVDRHANGRVGRQEW